MQIASGVWIEHVLLSRPNLTAILRTACEKVCAKKQINNYNCVADSRQTSHARQNPSSVEAYDGLPDRWFGLSVSDSVVHVHVYALAWISLISSDVGLCFSLPSLPRMQKDGFIHIILCIVRHCNVIGQSKTTTPSIG